MTFDTTDDTNHQKPVTMRQVAEVAGVSMATVSRVLNGSGPVASQVAQHVRTVMSNLRYQPNRAASTLASSRSMFIGLLLCDIQNLFFIEMLRGIEEEARRNGYLLIVCNNPPDRQGTKDQRQYIEVLAAAPVAGAIIIPAHERLKELELLKMRNIPIVVVDQRIRDSSVDTVRIDNVMAAKEAVTHLISNGHRRIGIITGPRLASTANERLSGYHQALQEAGIEHNAALEHRGPFYEETAHKATNALLELDPPVDAIFATNNRLAVGALHTLYRKHKRIPDDIALVGFDEIYWTVSDMASITTIIQPAYEIGRSAAHRLIQRIRQPNTPRHEIILPHQLIIGESSRPHTRPDLLEAAPSGGTPSP